MNTDMIRHMIKLASIHTEGNGKAEALAQLAALESRLATANGLLVRILKATEYAETFNSMKVELQQSRTAAIAHLAGETIVNPLTAEVERLEKRVAELEAYTDEVSAKYATASAEVERLRGLVGELMEALLHQLKVVVIGSPMSDLITRARAELKPVEGVEEVENESL